MEWRRLRGLQRSDGRRHLMSFSFSWPARSGPSWEVWGRPTCSLEERSVDARISIMRSSPLMRQSSAWTRNPSAEDNPP